MPWRSVTCSCIQEAYGQFVLSDRFVYRQSDVVWECFLYCSSKRLASLLAFQPENVLLERETKILT